MDGMAPICISWRVTASPAHPIALVFFLPQLHQMQTRSRHTHAQRPLDIVAGEINLLTCRSCSVSCVEWRWNENRYF